MNGLSKYVIDIINLKIQEYRYEFKIDPSFFTYFNESEIEKGSLVCQIALRKTEGFIEADFHIHGLVELECDRSLDKFDYTVELERKMIFKFGEEDIEINDEVEMISHNRSAIDMSQYIYEFISMGIPMKKLHPRYNNEEQNNEGDLYYTSSGPVNRKEEGNLEETDPRWEVLKKLKNN
jgi:uncharacterized metal-binding protein YceD (DUF177 family)